ncbi:MAG TPA: hypothetical protein VFN30_14610 [Chitinophagaceae bacterium]|nr:hypothetical protein [Chitinophagaceae bacterium]
MHLIQEYAVYFLSLILSVVPIWREASLIKNAKKNKNEKKPISYLGFLAFLFIALIVFGYMKISSDYKERISNTNTIDSLNRNINTLGKNSNKLKETIDEFDKKLEKQFGIRRDTLTNEPIKMTFITNIKKAETVNIGSN